MAEEDVSGHLEPEKRPTPREIGYLTSYWLELPEEAGLASNMAATQMRLSQLSHGDTTLREERKARKESAGKLLERVLGRKMDEDGLIRVLDEHGQPVPTPSESPAEALERRAREAAAHYPCPLDLPPEEPTTIRLALALPGRSRAKWWNPKDGIHEYEQPGDVRVAKGVRADWIHCHSAGSTSGCGRMVPIEMRDEQGNMTTELVGAPLRLEGWAAGGWGNSKTAAKHRAKLGQLRTTRLALRRMVSDRLCPFCYGAPRLIVGESMCNVCEGEGTIPGNADLVGVLFRMYGRAIPPSELQNYVGDLWPIALDTKIVREHAALMTRRLRIALMIGASQPRRVVQSSTAKYERAWLSGETIEKMDGEAFTPKEMADVISMRRVSLEETKVVHIDRRESVSLAEAALDLVEKRQGESQHRKDRREQNATIMRSESRDILHLAAVSFRAALRHARGVR